MRCVVSIAVLLASGAWAQTIYRWTDARGTVHYTDDPSTIPPNAKVTTTEGEEISNTGTPEKTSAAAAPAQAVAAQPAPETAAREEQYWRDQFRVAREKLRSLEDELAADQRKYDWTLPMSGTYYCPPYSFYRPYGYGYGGYGYGYGNKVQKEQVGVKGSVSVPVGGSGSINGTLNVNAQVTQGFKSQSGVLPFTGYGGCWYAPDGEYQRTVDRIEQTRLSVDRAKEDLAELERRAANSAVPLEWRR